MAVPLGKQNTRYQKGTIENQMVEILPDCGMILSLYSAFSIKTGNGVVERNPFMNRNGDDNMTDVVAALIWKDDRFLICQRPVTKARGLLWEFVGGKVEPGETNEEALIRECREELDITISVDDLFVDLVHVYPDLTVHLFLYHAAIQKGNPKLLEHNDLRWITAEEIPRYEFCPADTEILEKIRQLKIRDGLR